MTATSLGRSPYRHLSEAEADAWIEAAAGSDPADPPPEDDTWGQPLAFELPPLSRSR